jgi:hypothetical protein
LRGAEVKSWASNDDDSLEKELKQAKRLGDQKRVQELTAQSAEAAKARISASFDELRKNSDYDPEIIKLYRAQATDNLTQHKLSPELSERLGPINKFDDESQPAQSRAGARWGIVSMEKIKIIFNFVAVNDLFYGPAALVQWACGLACTNIKYSFNFQEPESEY